MRMRKVTSKGAGKLAPNPKPGKQTSKRIASNASAMLNLKRDEWYALILSAVARKLNGDPEQYNQLFSDHKAIAASALTQVEDP